ncbi:MAG: tRNA uridine-5-carboxymethylaminomethyl(34) synthesis GTPase MnmE [Bacillota bacterium]
MSDDTIAAIGTAPGEAAIGVVRISGGAAIDVARKVFRPRRQGLLDHGGGWRVGLGLIVEVGSGEVIDEGIAVVMPGPHSYTREDVVEIQCHGGGVVLRRTLESVLRAGARLAGPGEFTLRAFLNGRIDLTQAEAVVDLVRAQTEASSRVALDQLRGSLSRRIGEIKRRIVELLALIEGCIDFPEDDVAEPPRELLVERLGGVVYSIDRLLSSARVGIVVREGAKVAIVGRPNVGKSSLLNALVGTERAIVTDVPGTTRDVVSEVVDVGGVAVRLCDTAGIRETRDLVEGIGVERAIGEVTSADVVIVVVDDSEGLTKGDREVFGIVGEALREGRGIIAVNKIDLDMGRVGDEELSLWKGSCPVVRISCRTGRGLDALRKMLKELILGRWEPETGMVTRVRHKVALEEARGACVRAGEGLRRGDPIDLVAVELREAAECLAKVTGEVVTDEVIDEVFSTFCVGK